MKQVSGRSEIRTQVPGAPGFKTTMEAEIFSEMKEKYHTVTVDNGE